MLDKMRVEKDFEHVLLKSDYWKKFEGTVLKQGLCKSAPKQSVETHSAWYLIPPKNAVGVDWSVFPEDVEHVPPDEDGFRGFVVEFYNIISDVVVQDGYQSVLNLRTVLDKIHSRHPRIKRCSRETDGAGSYNSVFVALFSLQLGQGGNEAQGGGIRVVYHSHNEPGHGADICDTAGANCIRECWRYTKRTGLSVIAANKTCACLRQAEMDGFIHLQVSHDPDRKIVLSKKAGFAGVFIKKCLTKEYPTVGPYAGGIVFRRCYRQGSGIGFTKMECESMWSGVNLDDHSMLVHGEKDPGTATSVPDANETSVDETGAEPGTEQQTEPANDGAAVTADANEQHVRTGDSVEVWWDENEAWYPGIVMHVKPDNNGTAWECRYDDERKPYWHDLDTERFRRIPPTIERLSRLRVKRLRWRLRQDRVQYDSSARKKVLVNTLFTHMCDNPPADTANTAGGTEAANTAGGAEAANTAGGTEAAGDAGGTEAAGDAGGTEAANTGPTEATGAAGDTEAAGAAGKQVRPGDSVEVWWEQPEGFFACVVAEQSPDLRDTTTSLCLYDDGAQRWHDLEAERYRRISPAIERLAKVGDAVLHTRLRLEGIQFEEQAAKKELEGLLCKTLLARFQPVKDTAYQPRSKRGFTHKHRVTSRKRNRLDMEKANDEDAEWGKRLAKGEGKPLMPRNPVKRLNTHRTATMVVQDIGIHGMALYTLSTRGNRREERQHERDGYNLLTFSTSVVGERWTPGDTDMGKMTPRVSSVYDTTGWLCINNYSDGRVVMKRPPAPIPVRGCCAQRRKVHTIHTLSRTHC